MNQNQPVAIHDILKLTFGYSTFREGQEAIIRSVIDGNDELVIMPTGGGKSICYQIPALVYDGLTVVISPLIALMDDQVAALRQLDVSAAALHTNIDPGESSDIFANIANKKLKLLYVSPEKVLSTGFVDFLQQQDVCLFAIDEAHCVSVWGNDFRPEYVKLSRLKNVFPNVPTIALTATADAATQKDIITQLKLRTDEAQVSSFERTNIHTAAKPGQKRAEQILQFLSSNPDGAGIVYCLSRKNTETVAAKLAGRGYKAKAYHAGLDASTRRKVQEDFQSDDIQIVCATIAFGMGIDKPNIRWVIHYNMPKNIEGYYQEIGRAGRDGLPAQALLFYSWADYLNLQRFITESAAIESFKEVQHAKLERMWHLATALSCRTNLVLNYFGEFKNDACDHCDNCLEPKEMFDGTQYAQMALSAIVRTKESVGINLLIEILRGSNKQEIISLGYNSLKTYGVGRNVPFNDWRYYVTQMLNQGIITIDFTDFSKLKLTPLSKAAIYGQSTIQLARFIPNDKKEKVSIPKIEVDLSDMDAILLKSLKSWRTTKARAQKVPPFLILQDKALKQIAALKPDTSEKLMSVDGIGAVKLRKYGEELIELVVG